LTDSEEFERFVRRYQNMVYGVAIRMLADPAEAEDVAQTVFLRAFERFGVLRDQPTVPGWLRTVATNLCLNHLTRVRPRWRQFSVGRFEHGRSRSSPEERMPAPDDPERDVLQAEQRAELERALQGLPAHQRVPLVLFHFQERSYREIAKLLGVSLSKVKTDIHRGRIALRAVVGGSK